MAAITKCVGCDFLKTVWYLFESTTTPRMGELGGVYVCVCGWYINGMT